MPIPYTQFKSIDEIDISFVQDDLLRDCIEKMLDHLIRYQNELNLANRNENIWEYIYMYIVAAGELAVRISQHLEEIKKRVMITVIVNDEEKIIDVYGIAFIAVQDIIIYGLNGFQKMFEYIQTKNSYIIKRLNGDKSIELLNAFIDINTNMRRQYEKAYNEIVNHWFSKDFSL